MHRGITSGPADHVRAGHTYDTRRGVVRTFGVKLYSASPHVAGQFFVCCEAELRRRRDFLFLPCDLVLSLDSRCTATRHKISIFALWRGPSLASTSKIEHTTATTSDPYRSPGTSQIQCSVCIRACKLHIAHVIHRVAYSTHESTHATRHTDDRGLRMKPRGHLCGCARTVRTSVSDDRLVALVISAWQRVLSLRLAAAGSSLRGVVSGTGSVAVAR